MSIHTKSLVVITGSSSGIGQATAKLFSKQGYPLLLLARRVEPMEALKLPNVLCRALDVTDRNAFGVAVQAAEEKFGPVDAIINNAGLMLLGKIVQQNPAEWDKMLDVNVRGLLNGIFAVVSGMVKRQRGTIINISSVAGKKTFPNHVAYTATKFAVHGLSENLREELSEYAVRVITIAPGAVETELLSHTTDESIKSGYQDWKTNMGGALTAEDIANAISYAYHQPQNVCVREIVLAATRQQA